MKLLIIAFLVVSCATKKKITLKEKNIPVKATHSVSVSPGKVKFVRFPILVKDGAIKLNCNAFKNNKKLKSFKFTGIVTANTFNGYLVDSYFSKKTKIDCYHSNFKYLSVEVKDFPYKKEKLNVDKRRVFLNKKDLARVIKERKIKANIYVKSAPDYMFTSEFQVPLNSYITSHYGNKRLFNNKKQSQHLGNDFRAKVGVEIPSTNRGRIVFTGKLFYTGNAVVIDHGLGIFSVYGHLSKIMVKKGDIVNKGDIIALSGATGRVSGPHLHWGIKINGHWVDGFSLITESKKHFK